jgi:hypothetical protein
MKIVRILTQGFILTFINIAAILVAFAIYKVVDNIISVNQRALQTPVAMVLSVAAFVAWIFIANRFFSRLYLRGSGEHLAVFFGALLWNPVLFTILHYITRGYLTSFANILLLWVFQIPVNLVAVLIAMRIPDREQRIEKL